jgi:tRNA A-37 threonylcarbamoyl transferase component Bud32
MSAVDEDLAERANARLGALLKGKYTLDRVLGSGGMATVYAATHRNGKEFAVKVLHADLSMRTDMRTRFLREGYLANRVNHPGAVAVLDDDIAEDGGAFLVMELIRGQTVESLWEGQRGRLPWSLVAGIGLQLLDVLAAAHARGLIHRDIKPGNLMLSHDGQLKVLDFGIARLRDMAGAHTTQTGMVMGTPAFMAPEHAMAKTEEIDAQTDVWAVGATMFTLATGKLVHEADNTQQLLIKAATTPARSVASLMPAMPKGMSEVIDRALAFEKSKRWPSALAMQTALRDAAREAFTTVPVASVLAEMLDELVERERTLLAPTEPPQPGPLKPIVDSDEIPTGTRAAVARAAAVETLVGTVAPESPPAVGVITAAAVATDSSLRRTASRPRGIAAAGAALAGIGIGVVLLVVTRASPSKDAPTAGSATRATAIAAPSTPVSASAAAPAVTGAWTAVAVVPAPIATQPAAPTRVAPQPPSVPVAPRPHPQGAPAAAPPASAAKPNCNPPYEFDESGNKRWKRECL